MVVIQKYWEVRNPNPQLQGELSNQLKIHPIVCQLLINRGITDARQAREFLKGDMSQLPDPFLLKDMDRAVDRIKTAKEKRERVLIYGDYDADGVASTALLYGALKRYGIDVITHIPHRMHDGYGLNKNVGQLAETKKADLLISVDCGINALHEVAILNKHGVDSIIIDHHEPSTDGLPQACAVIDPKRKDCPYPFKELASVGLVAKFIEALYGEIPKDDLGLVALGTITDVVSLRGENRTFVREGLPVLSKTKNKGLSALIDVAKLKGKTFQPYYVGFILGPRINASGRLDTAKRALDLLLSESDEEAYHLARSLENLNVKRQKLQNEMIQDALRIVEREVNFKESKVIVIHKEGWHKGVLGIVASRVAETYYRPSVVISVENGVGTASARSIEGFALNEALSHCADTLEEFGGHRQAAGLTIKEENIGRFKESINSFADEILKVRDLVPSIKIDCEVPLSVLSLDLVEKVCLLEPYGEGNPEPIFCSRHLTVRSQPAVLGKDTLKFWVSDGEVTVSAIGFGMGRYRDMIVPNTELDLAYRLSIDDWNKAPAIQLRLKDIKRASD